MSPKRIITFTLGLMLCGRAFAQTQDIDKELTDLAGRLTAPIKDSALKKVTVIDFTDLDGGTSDLGKYIADQLTVDLVMAKHDFSVLDRANLKSILDEHSLTAKGLVDPKNAKQLGQFAGVDAIILGSIVPRSNSVSLTARIVTTDTAEDVGAAKAVFALDDNVRQLMANATPGTATGDSGDGSEKDSGAVTKVIGGGALRVQMSLRVIDDARYMATMVLQNTSSTEKIWVALSTEPTRNSDEKRVKGRLTNPDGKQYGIVGNDMYGIVAATRFDRKAFNPTLTINPGATVTATITFAYGAYIIPKAPPGTCTVQLEYALGHKFGTDDAFYNFASFFGDVQAK